MGRKERRKGGGETNTWITGNGMVRSYASNDKRQKIKKLKKQKKMPTWNKTANSNKNKKTQTTKKSANFFTSLSHHFGGKTINHNRHQNNENHQTKNKKTTHFVFPFFPLAFLIVVLIERRKKVPRCTFNRNLCRPSFSFSARAIHFGIKGGDWKLGLSLFFFSLLLQFFAEHFPPTSGLVQFQVRVVAWVAVIAVQFFPFTLYYFSSTFDAFKRKKKNPKKKAPWSEWTKSSVRNARYVVVPRPSQEARPTLSRFLFLFCVCTFIPCSFAALCRFSFSFSFFLFVLFFAFLRLSSFECASLFLACRGLKRSRTQRWARRWTSCFRGN